MSAGFDPYHKWLGIPPKDQPPNHYRLLGLQLFEADEDVIDAAANRIMAYLHEVSTGDGADHAQKILNEISAARLCLLNADKKSEYDQRLRARKKKIRAAREARLAQAQQAQPAVEKNEPPPVGPARSTTEFAALGELNAEPEQSTAVALRKKHSSTPMLWGLAIFAVAAVGIAGTLVYLLDSGDGTSQAEAAAAGEQDAPAQKRIEDAVLTMDWPQDQRTGAKLAVNGYDRSIPLDGEFELKLNAGRNRLVIIRPGYESIRETLVVRAGEQRSFSPVWIANDTPPPTEVVEASEANGGEPLRDPLPDLNSGSTPQLAVDLPLAIELPKPPQKFQTIGTVTIPRGEVQLELLGGNQVLPQGKRFQLLKTDNVPNGPGNPPTTVWFVVLVDGSGTSTRLAGISVDRQRMVFGWVNAEVPESQQLGNCAIRVTWEEEIDHVIALREPAVVELIPFAGKDGTTMLTVPVDNLPAPRALRLEIVGVRGSQLFRTPNKPKPIKSNAETVVPLSGPEDLPAAAEFTYSVRPQAGTIKFSTRLLYQTPQGTELKFFAPKIAKGERERLTREIGRTQAEKKKLGGGRKNQERVATVNKQIQDLTMWRDYYDELLKSVSGDAQIGLRFRLYANVGGQKVEILTTEI